ncbi:hypothetical protein AB4097_19335 [Microvirga sp. 2MCAF35]|uniref:hypothetical protein n=1 Tax=Microvirga sp. 2MCAF35 TaxID=3232987 RepID=UPI003F95B706
MDREDSYLDFLKELAEMSRAEREPILCRDMSLKEEFEEWLPGFRATQQRLANSQTTRSIQPLADRDFLTAEDFKKLYTAIVNANFDGISLTNLLSINWNMLGCDRKSASNHFSALRSRTQWWMRDNQLGWHGIYVWENPSDILNCHLLFHLPPTRRGPDKRRKGYDKRERGFRPWLERTICDLLDVPTLPNGSVDLQCRNEEALDAQWHWFRYMMKGLDPDAWVRDGEGRLVRLADKAEIELKPQGRIIGKRAGATQSLNTKEVEHWQYKTNRPTSLFATDQLYGDSAWYAGRSIRDYIRRGDLQGLHTFLRFF